jgi:restriction system protein
MLMESTNKCLKEWNATIEALGQGKQTILIRSYSTTSNGFLLYPTVSYANKDNFLEGFQPEYQSFVEENTLPDKEGDKVEIKYYATVEKIIEKSPSVISRLQKNYIWTSEHVRNYLNGKKAQVWVLRVYKLKEPYLAEPTPGAIKYANLKRGVPLKDINPILTDKEFLITFNALK